VLCWRALKRFEEINNNYGRAHTENHLGILFTKTSRWAFAADHLNRACAIWQEMGDNHGLMKGLINLSSLYIDSERPTEAIYHLKKAVEQAELTGDVVEYGTIYLNMSAAYNLSGDYVTGAAYAYQAETLFQQYANKYYLAITWGNLGASLVGQGKWLEADHYLRASIETCRKLGNKYEEINALSHKVKLELARGDQVEAAKFIKKLENLAAQYRRQEVFKKKIALKLKEFGRELGK
jgi:tetratricopeptide (TPR) repeat protein